MGFFDKIKGAVNAVTGGSAKVTLEAISPTMHAPFKVRVSATVASADINVAAVYVIVAGHESTTRPSSDSDSSSSDETSTITTFEERVTLASAQTLKAGQRYQWEGEVAIPDHAPNPYRGHSASHEIKAMAGLDMPGNDPDSGWITLNL